MTIRVTFTDDGSACDLDDDTAVQVWGRLWPLSLRNLRGQDDVTVGGRPVTVETYQEQIARLTAERDAAIGRIEGAEMMYRIETKFVRAAHDTEKARAEKAEKRLADLRAWADDIVKRSREEAPKHPGKADTTWTILSVLEWVVARIDGKDGESK